MWRMEYLLYSSFFLLKWQNMCYDITIIKKRLELKGEYEWQKN